MKQNGITRRIDELGRIVIPKEIRKNMKIRNNDELLINIDNNEIILSKHEKVNKDEIIELLINSFSKELNVNILVTSKDMVIMSTKNKYNDMVLSNSLVSKIEKREIVESLKLEKINLFNDFLEVSYIIMPFSLYGDVLGSVIIFSKKDIDKHVVFCTNIIRRFLENYLEE